MSNDSQVFSSLHAFYSPGVGRFFSISSLDEFTAYEVAQILSSKMPSIVLFAIEGNTPPFFHDNSHEYGLLNKNAFKDSYERQTPICKKMDMDNITKLGEMPVDFNPKSNIENWKVFSQFKDYTEFVMRVWYAAKRTEMIHNFFPFENYALEFFRDSLPEDFEAKPDVSLGKTKIGIKREIKEILYYGNSEQDVLAKIKKMWEENSTVYTGKWRGEFYRIAGIDPAIKELPKTLEDYTGWIM